MHALPVLDAFDYALQLGALVLVLVAWRLPKARFELSIVAASAAAFGAVVAVVLTGADHIVALGATSGEVLDLVQKERILAEGFADGVPRLVGASAAVALTSAWCVVAFGSRGARFVTLGAAAVLLAPIAWLGTRGVGLHDRIVREASSQANSTSSDGYSEVSRRKAAF